MTDKTIIDRKMIEGLGEVAREAGKQGRKICCNTSVAAFVRNREGLYLVIRRTKKPLGYAGVAGHALDEREDWLESMKAELREEVGIIVEKDSDLRPIEKLKGVYTNMCSRPGCRFHAWKVYDLVVDGTPGKMTGDDGVKSVHWVTKDRLRELCEKTREWYSRGKPDGEDDHMEPIAVIHLAKADVIDIDISFIEDIRRLPHEGDY
ncbi:MAG: NUDIX hydrolase [Candidatus Moranbacteria bacterium]|nr:NUDIX hydrolase [Candidatus Moranbacteria bacterium]